MTRQSMTVAALSFAADHAESMDTVAILIGGEDERTVDTFFSNEWASWTDDRVKDATVIGVVLDMGGNAVTLTRDDARDMFGDDLITAWEAEQSDSATRALAWEMAE